MNWPSHGSNPQYLYEAMGLTLSDRYIDFSANINPLGPPAMLKDKWNEIFPEITVYPDPHGKHLKEKIATQEKLQVESILLGNGGAELITLVARIFAGKRVLLIQPTFSEYEQACKVNHCDIRYHQLKEPSFDLSLDELLSDLQDSDALFLCNPNNPTGIRYPTTKLISLIEACERQNCFVILDEAFYDFLLEYESFIPYINRFSKLIIIRSMTKMFAIPGIRLGYLVAQPEIILLLSQLQSHWSTNTIALWAGELCLQEKLFVKETQIYMERERQRLFEFFSRERFIASPSKVNFYLLRDPILQDSFPLFKFLLQKGVIPRHTINFPGLEGRWLRFAIKGREENKQLMEVLTEWRTSHH